MILPNKKSKMQLNIVTSKMIEVAAGMNERHLIQVRTLLGGLLYSKEFIFTGNSNVHELDLSALTPGLYFVSLSRDGKLGRTLPLFIQK
jgi:hypothetical protein